MHIYANLCPAPVCSLVCALHTVQAHSSRRGSEVQAQCCGPWCPTHVRCLGCWWLTNWRTRSLRAWTSNSCSGVSASVVQVSWFVG
eukprot:scaffold322475_cov21-Tisochrysis_lutea.AAC.1